MRMVVRPIRRDDRGVASTVGTIMAILVFLTFLSLIVNQYVPVWMKDSEAAHMNAAVGQFGGFKGTIDLQVLAAQVAQQVGLHYIPVTSSTPVTLGLDGVPIFAAPTVGEMTVRPDDGPWSVVFYYDIRGVPTRVTEAASGAVLLDVGNRYFIPQRIVYENGAVLKWQLDGQTMRAQPVFEPSRVNNTLDLSFQLVSIYGRGGVTGTSTEIVSTKLFGLDRQDYEDLSSSIWINHTSAYGLAWYNFLNASLSQRTGITSGQYARSPATGTPLTVEYIGKIGAEIVYRIQANYNSSSQRWTVSLEVMNASALPLGIFRLQHAYIEVGVGSETEDLLI